ncbi:MAG: rRNA pseudouridine synthase [Planctomycetes bacterium]|nr:rRNA pseudouridine synthase [Planctomycetota bacterium]
MIRARSHGARPSGACPADGSRRVRPLVGPEARGVPSSARTEAAGTAWSSSASILATDARPRGTPRRCSRGAIPTTICARSVPGPTACAASRTRRRFGWRRERRRRRARGRRTPGRSARRRRQSGAGGGRAQRQRHARNPSDRAEHTAGRRAHAEREARDGDASGESGARDASDAPASRSGSPLRTKHVRAKKALSRVLSRAGLCSRKDAERLVAAHRVTVNGRLARDPEQRIDEQRDDVCVDGRRVARAATIVVLLHKPAGHVTTLRDERGRATVYDLLRDVPAFVVPVGRLDRDTTGLLLLTNDTRLADKLTDPVSHVPKVYRALVRGALDDGALAGLRRGIELDDGPTRPAEVRRLREGRRGTLLEIVLTEGRNRQVRRMVEAVGSKVRFLKRVRLGSLTLHGVPRGEWRALDPDEVAALRGRKRDKREQGDD